MKKEINVKLCDNQIHEMCEEQDGNVTDVLTKIFLGAQTFYFNLKNIKSID